MDEIGETILPETPGSPGAKAAKIGEFMKVMVTDCYIASDQTVFLEGIIKLNDVAREMMSNDFMSLNAEEKTRFLEEVDKEANEFESSRERDTPKHYFTMMKELTLWGFFSSEVGATKALRYVETPGKWEACMPYKKGDKAWAT